MKKQDINN